MQRIWSAASSARPSGSRSEMKNLNLLTPLMLLLLVARVLAACTDSTWRHDPAVEAARNACRSQTGVEYNCVEHEAVAASNPEICRLVGIYIDDMCLQAVYEAADDPTICDRIYLQGVVPNCRAYYAKRTASATLPSEASKPSPSPLPTASPTPSLVPDTSNTKPAQNEISPWPTPEHSIFGAEVTECIDQQNSPRPGMAMCVHGFSQMRCWGKHLRVT